MVRPSGFDCFMLACVTHQEDAVLAMQALQELIHLFSC